MKDTIILESEEEARNLFGALDQNVKTIEDLMDVEILARGRQLKVKGDKRSVSQCKSFIRDLLQENKKGRTIEQLIEAKRTPPKKNTFTLRENPYFSKCTRDVYPKTKGQEQYVKAIQNNEIVFGIGPAGTGKTYLAMASAIEAFKKREVEKIILCRPAVETGEKLGFLPGDLNAKINPYLRPLLDALHELMDSDEIRENIEKSLIEIVPLAYMRGRTLNDSFIILDEAQNSTKLQMKMFLTRMGMGSKIVVTGDITQIDFPKKSDSGLLEAKNILNRISGIKIINLKEQDIVRNPLVKSILKAYQK